ncbi:nucleoside 2-deoxyribosyltransferase [Burkholderia pseudomallei]|uniref:nucleoside 2-deoxyribosyltransferase n=2 Tax=Burkholderia pseudomallei TaxID=28450 RepID=UPI0004351D3F|nr:nucleoside 2-deoxyribosyltransferase [Burkholderia pseudomallei]EXI99524.1 sugar kinase [Burkholderia pseudomallei MSHR6137]KGS34389.1 nucleoside 2-deoxyribosyltransferase family protein [Burkholderia pseudomallei ABCPW 107]KGU66705.1 nucleoside 2-deoxyribosyltransferase family protein [Burkholderia pseudomallei MSHR465J]KGX47530.1 nucleoside 2-deoxyribosyltransferase family protein [Burkholderia pseudomallei MSHR2138]MBF3900103.1 nucleoside 2-deoxyribosyltransferase [Burkholderia pseudomal
MAFAHALLVVGELVVDFTLAQHGAKSKLRLGGVAHAARGLWAAGVDYSIAAFCSQYLVGEAERYLNELGCKEFIWLGDVVGSPNVIIIGDATEVSHQGYEDLMRDTKSLKLRDPLPSLEAYKRVIVFPGRFDVNALADAFSRDARFAFDVAYNIDDLSSLKGFRGRVQAVIISTSSSLFVSLGVDDVEGVISAVRPLAPDVFLLKENRGGSRLFDMREGAVEEIPATLGNTVNSVGVGDVYAAVMVGLADKGWTEAAWRGCQTATAYSQSTFPDDIKREVQRGFQLSLDELRALSGTILPWHDRQRYSIYLAGPDFSYVDKPELDRAADSLTYHNFKIRRPTLENGELRRPASEGELLRTYHLDCQLLKECDAVFAVPLARDPGTLVEIGMAIEMGKPVITYDPRHENENTMVVVGSSVYSADLDVCLNGTFDALAKLRTASQ